MARLDKKRPFGTIHPPYEGASFSQDGHYFNSEGQELDPATGETVDPTEEDQAAEVAEVAQAPASRLTAVNELISLSASMSFIAFRVKAAVLLGIEPPATKTDTLAALKVLAASLAPKPKPAAPAAPAAPSGEVDLAAWGRGDADYLFGDVAKAIAEKHHRIVQNTRDAVDALIEDEVITSAEARKVVE